MNQLIAICYVSSAVKLFTATQLDALLLSARQFNQEHKVTGALLHHDGCFFQYIEGDAEAIQLVYQRISNSNQHHNIIKLLETSINQRYFSEWHMGYADITQTQLQQLTQAEWKKSIEERTPEGNLAIKLLLNFWRISRHE